MSTTISDKETNTSNGYDFGTSNDQLIITKTGALIGQSGEGIENFGNNNSTDNGGHIYGGDKGIELDGTGDSVTNEKTGVISGTSAGVFTFGGNTIVNHGTITGDTAVQIEGNTVGSLTNDGTIAGSTGVLIDATGGAVVTNSGTVSGGLWGIQATSAGATIHNTGTINGDVSFFSGTNLLDGVGGTVNGSITGGTGNDMFDLRNQTVTGTVDGGAGNDTYMVASTGIVVTEAVNAGTDTVHSTISYTLPTNVEQLVLDGTGNINGTGNSLNNVLIGNSANNVLNGGAGADGMAGGAGNDTYVVDNSGDVVSEALGAGLDTVHSTIDYGLPSNVEQLVLDGTGNINGAGNSLNNTLVGNSGNNVLTGGGGADGLMGGAGADTFKYTATSDSTVAAPDRIADFQHGIDKIDLTALHLAKAGDVTISSASGQTTIGIDSNNDGTVDMKINLTGANAATMSDIVTGIASPAVAHPVVAEAATSAAIPAPTSSGVHQFIQAAASFGAVAGGPIVAVSHAAASPALVLAAAHQHAA